MGQISEKMTESISQWYKHTSVGRKVLEMELPGKRIMGRPKKRSINAVKYGMWEVGVRKEICRTEEKEEGKFAEPIYRKNGNSRKIKKTNPV